MPSPAPITEPYLLVTHIPNYVDAKGQRWTDALWLKDLREHFLYLHNLTLAAPLAKGAPPATAARFDPTIVPAGTKFIDLPRNRSLPRAILNWPRTFLKLWRAIGKARVVHFGVAEWPIPTGWTVSLITRLRRRKLSVLVIESAFWRTGGAKAKVWERMTRWAVNGVSMPIFTQAQYRDELLNDPSRGHVIAASWIDADNVLSPEAVEAAWDRKLAAPPRLLFAARLVEEKGVHVLLDAVRLLRARSDVPAFTLDVIGSGALRGAIEAVAAEANGAVTIRVLDPVPYGPPFFSLVTEHDALVIPSISDEQPRLVYDSFSQGVPVLASATPGIAACVDDGRTGRLVTPRDPAALADLIVAALSDRNAIRAMGRTALSVAAAYTHRTMHAQRWQLLSDRIAAGE